MTVLTVILLQPHTHAGIAHPAGEALNLPQPDAEWLVARGVANFRPGKHKHAPARDSAATSDTSGSDAAVTHNPTDEPGDTHEH